ncbi:MAG: fibronectin type III domain-containing protein, partial [Marinilabilia sp.]
MRKPLLLNLFFAFFLAPLSMEGQTINEAIDNEDLSISLSGDADWEGQTQESWDGEDAARSGDITDDQTSKMETTVYGPGTLSFYWKVSSESYYDQLQFQVDGMVEDNISGLTDWTLVEYSVPEGEHTISWEYTKDGSVSDNEDCGWIDMVTYDGPSCYAGEINLEDFTSDQALLSWNTGGDMVDTWHVEWGESGFVQGEGNQATVNEESYWIEGLNENSYYDFYVQPVCSEEDGIWAGPFSFNILEGDNCDNAIDLSTLTLPYRDNTSSYNNDFNNWYSASSKDMVFYRDVEDQAAIDVMLSSDFFETVLELSVGQDCPGEEGVFSDFGNNVKGSWFNDSGETKRLWIVVSGYDGEEGSFSLDEEYYEPGTCLTPGNVQSSGLTDRSAQIDWDPFGKADVWEVLYGPEGFDPESEGESMLASQTSVELTDLTPDQDYDVYVRSACGSDNFSEFSGKINFQTYPTCRVPSGLFVGSKTQTGAQLDWYSPQEITEWEIEYGPYGFTQGEGTTITDITESNYSLEGLEPSTIYEVYVRSNCGEDGYSDWSRGYVFSTECGGGGVGLPFEEDFDDLYLYDFNRLLPCWELYQDPDSESQVYTYYTDYMEYSGGQNLLLRAYAGSAAYLSFPEIGVDINQLMLRFKGLAPNSEPGFLEIGTMASPEDGSSFVSVKEIDLLDLGSEWNDIAMLFEEIPETHNYIALKIISPADNSLSFAMDEV